MNDTNNQPTSARLVFPSVQGMYEAAARWRDESLIGESSLFSGKRVDGATAASELIAAIVDETQGGGGDFFEKLRGQLAGVSAEAVQLAAELLYMHFLIVATDAIKADTKKAHIAKVLAFRTEETTAMPDNLAEALGGGASNPGQGFHSYRWKMLAYLIRVFEHFKSLGIDHRRTALADLDSFRAATQGIHVQTAWSQGFALEHLLFPEESPPVLSRDDRAAIEKAVSAKIGHPLNMEQAVQACEPNSFYGDMSCVNFYKTPHRELWKGQSDKLLLYTSWGCEVLQSGNIESRERQWKVDFSQQARATIDGLTSSADAAGELKKLLSSSNLVDYRVVEDFHDWARGNTQQAILAAEELGRHPGPDSIDRFLQFIPRDGDLSGEGARLSIASTLLMAFGVEHFPPWRHTVNEITVRLTSGVRAQESATTGEKYALFLELLDQTIYAMSKTANPLRDRLDAQSLVWTLAKSQSFEEWSDEQNAAFEKWRSGKSDIGPVDYEPVVITQDPAPILEATIETLAEELYFDDIGRGWLEETIELLQHKKQIILQGPPGTGKTYIARAIAKFLAEGAEQVVLTQFHPGTSYEDFIQGIRPDKDAPGNFVVTDGPFLKASRMAAQFPDKTFVFIIDEINRANIPAVFGELYYLLEYRNQEVTLNYGEQFSIPENLLVIGTMNTADRSITALDAALRRRFYLRDLFPHSTPVAGMLRRFLESVGTPVLWLAELLDEANNQIQDPDQMIGPSYFMDPKINELWARRAWSNSVMPTLREMFYNRPETLLEFEFDSLKSAAAERSSDAHLN